MGSTQQLFAASQPDDDDGALLAASAAGNAKAFARLVDRHFKPVYRVVWRLMNGHAEVEDVTQEAFLKLWQNPAQVREARALRGWLMRVASNLAFDRLRRKSHGELDEIENAADPRQITGAEFDEAQARGRVDRAVAALPERQKMALTLVYFEGLGNIEAARTMDVTVEAVESLLSRAKRALREGLAADWRLLLEELAEGPTR